jgi:hypothetical protein
MVWPASNVTSVKSSRQTRYPYGQAIGAIHEIEGIGDPTIHK